MMLATLIWECLAASVLLAWLLSCLPGLRRRVWTCLGLGVGVVGATGLSGLEPGAMTLAVLAPFGVMLPALCLRSILLRADIIAEPLVPRADLLVLAGLMLWVLLGAAGAAPGNPYVWFYAGIGPPALVVALAGWALWRRQAWVLGALVLAQLFWLADIGSSNFYDQIAHLVLIPALLIRALGRRA